MPLEKCAAFEQADLGRIRDKEETREGKRKDVRAGGSERKALENMREGEVSAAGRETGERAERESLCVNVSVSGDHRT